MKITQYIRNCVDNKRWICGGMLYLGHQLGHGMYGVVYAGVWDRNTCAIKVCYQQQNKQSLEVKYARIVKGDYLMHVIEVLQHSPDLFCIVMPKYSGTLQDIMDIPILSQKQKQKNLKSAIRSSILGLKQLANFGLSHGDIHADNVMYEDHTLGRKYVLIDYTMLKQLTKESYFRDIVFVARMIVKSLIGSKGFPKPNFDDVEEELKNIRTYEQLVPQWVSKFLYIKADTSFQELLSFLVDENKQQSQETQQSKKISDGKKRLQKANKKRKKPARQRNDFTTCKICLVRHARKDTRHLKNHPGYEKKKRNK